jgi:hypothetical protein
MSPPTPLTTVDDVDQRRVLHEKTASLLTRTADGKLGVIKRPGWIAIPAEAGMLVREDARRAMVDLLRGDGVDVVYAVPLHRANNVPPIEVPATEEALGAMQREIGIWDFVLYPPDVSWAIVETNEDIAAFLGPPQVVARLLGDDVAAARASLEDFLDDPDFWPEQMLTYFRSLIAAIESYDDLPDGEVAVLPVNV